MYGVCEVAQGTTRSNAQLKAEQLGKGFRRENEIFAKATGLFEQ